MPLDYTNCPLYSLKSKKVLKRLLRIEDNALFKQGYIVSFINPYIDKSRKPRLIESPHPKLKIIQKRIRNMLAKIEVPDNIFSGIRGRSYVDNATLHIGNRYLFKIDLTAFFPSIRRETVYSFFGEDLHCSPDVSEILTNFTTVDLTKASTKDIKEVYQFLKSKNIRSYNHLISGAPSSQVLSYLVNHKMFDEIQTISEENNVVMSVYVDDITFSSDFYISNKFKTKIYDVIKKYGYRVSKKKVKSYSKLCPKLVTGVIIDSAGQLTLRNSLRKKIIDEFVHLKNHPDDVISRKRLKGLITAARQIDRTAYPNIYKFVFQKHAK